MSGPLATPRTVVIAASRAPSTLPRVTSPDSSNVSVGCLVITLTTPAVVLLPYRVLWGPAQHLDALYVQQVADPDPGAGSRHAVDEQAHGRLEVGDIRLIADTAQPEARVDRPGVLKNVQRRDQLGPRGTYRCPPRPPRSASVTTVTDRGTSPNASGCLRATTTSSSRLTSSARTLAMAQMAPASRKLSDLRMAQAAF